MSSRPLAVRVLRAAGWLALAFATIAFGIGGILGFDELAKIWAVVGTISILGGIAALFGGRPTRGGIVAGLIACALFLILVPVGTFITVGIAVIASQQIDELRDYYGLRRKAAA